jgi:hypothetical protein
MERERKRLDEEAHESYLKLPQFDALYERINKIKRWVKG